MDAALAALIASGITGLAATGVPWTTAPRAAQARRRDLRRDAYSAALATGDVFGVNMDAATIKEAGRFLRDAKAQVDLIGSKKVRDAHSRWYSSQLAILNALEPLFKRYLERGEVPQPVDQFFEVTPDMWSAYYEARGVFLEVARRDLQADHG